MIRRLALELERDKGREVKRKLGKKLLPWKSKVENKD
jgi:hypothetical protein